MVVVCVMLVAVVARGEPAPKIVVELPKDRAACGRLSLLDSAGKRVAGPFEACGKADGKTARRKNNPGRSTILPFGDTPTGGYRVTRVFKVGTASHPAKSYGDYAAIGLQPQSGEAKLAADAGRVGLLIHGGDLGPTGKLRPTNGCVRLSNADMRKLVDEMVLLAARERPPESCSIELSTTVQVSEPAPDSDYEAGDPPPIPQTGGILP